MSEEKERSEGAKISNSVDKSSESGLGVVDLLRIIAGLLLLTTLGSYLVTGTFLWNYNPWWARPNAIAATLRSPVVLTDSELLAYAGQNESLPIYLALNGTIYDVTAGGRIYGPGGSYNVFAGRDATRAYITGCFQDDSVPDIRGIEWAFIPTDVPRFVETADEDLSEEMRKYRYEMIEAGWKEVDNAIEHWAKVFSGETGKDYWAVGHVSREQGFMEKLPFRPLCDLREKKRPKPQFDPKKTYKQRGPWARRLKKQQLAYAESTKPPVEGRHDEI